MVVSTGILITFIIYSLTACISLNDSLAAFMSYTCLTHVLHSYNLLVTVFRLFSTDTANAFISLSLNIGSAPFSAYIFNCPQDLKVKQYFQMALSDSTSTAFSAYTSTDMSFAFRA